MAQLKDLIVNGDSRFIGHVGAGTIDAELLNVTGNVTAPNFKGNADTATKATGDQSGNNIKASYGHSLSLSGSSLSLVNMNGAAVGSAVTLPSLSDIDCGTY